MKNKSTKWVCIVAAILILGMFGACSSGSSSSSRSNSGYSSTYQTDSEYRQNVKDISDVYGISEKEVDQKLNSVVDKMNEKK